MVTADHGNAEKMIAPDGSKHTAHTCNLGTLSIIIFIKIHHMGLKYIGYFFSRVPNELLLLIFRNIFRMLNLVCLI